MKAGSKKPRIGEMLVEAGALSQDQLHKALNEQKASGRMLGELLVEHGVSRSVLVPALARWLGVPGCQLRHGLIDPALLKLVGPEEAEPQFRSPGKPRLMATAPTPFRKSCRP